MIKKKQLTFLSLAVFVLLSFVFVLLPARSFADSVSDEESNITITPSKFNLSLSHGDKLDNYIRIYNGNDYETVVSLALENIGLVREDGEVVIGGSHSGYPSILQPWVKFDPESINIKPKKAGFIKMTINVPDDAAYGGHYSSIVAKQAKLVSTDDDNQTNATLASLIMLSIAGDTKNQANIQSFTLKNIGNHDYDISVRIQNTGNDHVRPNGMVVVSDIWGHKVSEMVFSGDNVLPGAIRNSTRTLELPDNMFGFYNVSFIANYGFNNEGQLTANKPIIIHPWLFFILWFIIISIIVLLIRSLVRRYKKKA